MPGATPPLVSTAIFKGLSSRSLPFLRVTYPFCPLLAPRPGCRGRCLGSIPPTKRRRGMESRTLKVMSFNVRGASHRDGVNAWPGRAGINVETIERYAPDLIGLQEVHAPNLEVYERDLPGYEKIMGTA